MRERSRSLEQAPFRIGTSCFKTAAKRAAGHLAWPGKGITATWEADLSFPGGTLALVIVGPNFKTSGLIQLNAYVNGAGITIWRFLCPKMSSRHCKKRVRFLYRGPDNQLSCHKCAGLEYDSRRIRDMGIYKLMRHPEEIRRILSSPYVPARLKLRALTAAERLKGRRDRLQKKLDRLKAATTPSFLG